MPKQIWPVPPRPEKPSDHRIEALLSNRLTLTNFRRTITSVPTTFLEAFLREQQLVAGFLVKINLRSLVHDLYGLNPAEVKTVDGVAK